MTDEGGKHFRVKRISGTSKSAATGPSIIDAATEKRYVRCQSERGVRVVVRGNGEQVVINIAPARMR